VWQGRAGERQWIWQADFGQARALGSILQVQGSHPFVSRNVPSHYLWEGSADGVRWEVLPGTEVLGERRLFRIHRLVRAVPVRFVRLRVESAGEEFPVLREVEFYGSRRARIRFPEWVVAVNTTHDRTLPGHGQEFIPLARAAAGASRLEAQQVWVGEFDEAFLGVEPQPLCGFLSGNFKDWCEVNREAWRGPQGVLAAGRLPLWASCGGAQGLAILAETGVDRPWDCPHCRVATSPRLPIYTHIGHAGSAPCGDYSACVFERGPTWIRREREDPVFRGLPTEFQAMQSHCGQVEWPPRGWVRIATAGPGGLTRTQCLRVKGRPIYAAQFHIEMAGTPETSARLMANFLAEARRWGGYRESARRLKLPSSSRASGGGAPATPGGPE
jgi:hypothetical protein